MTQAVVDPAAAAPGPRAHGEGFHLPSAVLSTAMHLLLALLLVFGIQWQSKAPDTVMVELWNAPPEVPPAPRPPDPPPPAEVKPEPRPVVKAEPPRPELRPPVRPDIAIEKERKPPPKKPAPKEEPRLDLKVDLRAQLERELAQVARRRPETQARPAPAPVPAAPSGAPAPDAAYVNRIRSKIRGNIVLPSDIAGNPEAIFDVVQIPSGEVISVKLRKSSGNRAYDEAVERAILKSSPLPRPDRADQFQRALELRFRPVE